MGAATSTQGGSTSGGPDPAAALRQWHEICAMHGAEVYHGAGDKSGPSGEGWNILRNHYQGGSPGPAGKQELLREIARTFGKKMGVVRIKEDDPLATIIAQLKSGVPNPQHADEGKRRAISPDPAVQKKVCHALAETVNAIAAKAGQGRPVAMDQTPLGMCNSAMDYVFSLMPGIASEFGFVQKDIQTALKNIRKLQKFEDMNFRQLEGKITSADSTVGAQTAVLRNVHKDIKEEINHYLTVLQNMLSSTVEPTNRELAVLLDGSDSDKRLMKKLDAHTPGRIGARIAYGLQGLLKATEAAFVVDKALGVLGENLKTYEGVRTSKQLADEEADLITKHLGDSEGKLADYLKAITIIRDHQYMHDDVVSELKKKRGKGEEAPAMVGGGPIRGGLKLDKRVRERRQVRDALLRVFINQFGRALDRVIHAEKHISSGVGAGQIKSTPALHKFAKALGMLEKVGQKYVSYALSGYDQSISSKREREVFISNADYMISVLGEVMKDSSGKGVEAFKDMRAGFETMLKIVRAFGEKFATGFQRVMPAGIKLPLGAADPKDPSIAANTDVVVAADSVTDEPVTGSAEEYMMGGAYIDENKDRTELGFPELTRLSSNFNRLKDEVVYSIRLQQIRDNLKKTSEELKSYGSDYTKVLSDAIASAVDAEVKATRERMAQLQESSAHDTKLDPLVLEWLFDGTSLKKDAALTDGKRKLTAYREFLGRQSKARINVYKVAEAADLYMKRFGEGVAAHPDSIPGILRMMESTHISVSWFSDQSGNALCQVYDRFPAYFDGAKAINSGIDVSGPMGKGKHYYELVSTAILTGSTIADSQIPSFGAKSLPGNPYLAVPVERMGSILAQTERALSIGALKNIFSTFVSIGDQFGGHKLSEESHMTPFEMYKLLVEYMTVSAFAPAYGGAKPTGKAAANGIADVTFDAPLGGLLTKADTTFPIGGTIRLGASGKAIAVGDPEYASRTTAYVGMRTVDKALAEQLYPDTFANANTDKLMVMVLKAVIAKVLTSVGIYNMFNRPINQHALGYFSGLRLVMGGSPQGGVDGTKVIVDALELYVRLPLIAEFYRKIFRFVREGEAGYREISLIPEMEGIFSGLISIIFDKARYVEDGGYSETDIRLLIEEINKIYTRFKNSENPTNAAIDEFIAEINRRYGIYKAEERRKYLEDRDQRYNSKYTTPEELTDFELPGLDEHYIPRPAPSDSYRTEGSGLNPSFKTHKHSLDLDHNTTMINELRSAIDAVFQTGMAAINKPDMYEPRSAMAEVDDTGGISFEPMLKARREELKHARSDKERFDIIVTAINSLGQFTINAQSNNLIAFHEMVVAPLNTIQCLYLSMKGFYAAVHSISDVIDAAERLKATPPARYVAVWDTVLTDPALRLGAGTQSGRNGATVNRNLAGVLAEVDAPGLAGKEAARYELATRFGLPLEYWMRRIVEALYTHAASLEKLVDLRIDIAKDGDDTCNIAVHLDHSKLHEYLNESFVNIKSAMDKFRGLLPETLIKAYEDYDDAHPGSVYSLEKNFIDEFMAGHRAFDKAKPAEVNRGAFEGIVAQVNQIFRLLTKVWSVDGASFAAGAAAAARFKSHVYDDAIWSMVSTGGVPAHVPTTTVINYGTAQGLHRLLYNNSEKEKQGVASHYSFLNKSAGIMYSPDLYDPKDGFPSRSGYRGVTVSFNRLVAAYIVQMYDEPVHKIYMPTINAFANGAFNKAVLGNAFWDDSVTPMTPLTNLSAADTKGVLLRTIAGVLRQLVTEPSAKGDKKEYLEPDLAEIPLYLKERMRGSLPIFRSLFHMLNRRCELLKPIVRAFNTTRPDPGARTPNEIALTSILEEVSAGCVSLLQCIQETEKDLADDPKFFETRANFIPEYRAANGVAPFMPPSSLLWYLRDNEDAYTPGKEGSESATAALPTASLGLTRFKLQYGSRGVLHSVAAKAGDLPGLAEILKAHNQSADGRHHVSEKEAQGMLTYILPLLRHLYVQRRLAPLLVTCYDESAGAPTRANLATYAVDQWEGSGTDQLRVTSAHPALVTYSMGHSLTEVVNMTESSDFRNQMRKIVNMLEESTANCKLRGGRTEMIAFNIMDLNKPVPINLAALQREVPLVHLIQAEYTYGKLMTEFFHTVNPMKDPEHRTLNVDVSDARTAKDLLCQLLISPHMAISDEQYWSLFTQIVRGDLGIEGLGEPKYIADEMYGKSLFGEIYGGPIYHGEEPSAGLGNAHLRGKKEVLADIHAPVQVNLRAIVVHVIQAYLTYYLVAGSRPHALFAMFEGSVTKDDMKDLALAAGVAYMGKDGSPADGSNFSSLVAREVKPAMTKMGVADGSINIALSLAQMLAVICSSPVIVRRILASYNSLIAMNPGGAGIGDAIHKSFASMDGNLTPLLIPKVIIDSLRTETPNDSSVIDSLGLGADGTALFSDLDKRYFNKGGKIPGLDLEAKSAIDRLGKAGITSRADAGSNMLDSKYVDDAGANLIMNLAVAFYGTMANITQTPTNFARLAPVARRTIMSDNPRYFPPELHYLSVDHAAQGDSKINAAKVGDMKPYLCHLGKFRFDTHLNRNLMFPVLAQRMLRKLLRDGLTWYNQDVVNGRDISAVSGTERFGQHLQTRGSSLAKY